MTQVIQVNATTRKIVLDNTQACVAWENANPLLPRGSKPPEKVVIIQYLSGGNWLSID